MAFYDYKGLTHVVINRPPSGAKRRRAVQERHRKLTSWTGMFSFINTFIEFMDVSSTK